MLDRSKIGSEAMIHYVAEHTPPPSALLAELTRETQETMSMPDMQLGHVEATFLRILLEMIGGKRVLEIGTFTGYTTLVLAQGVPDDGEVITCDIDPEATAVAQRYWAQSPHGHKIQLRLGPALDTINTLEGYIDFAFIDADKEGYIDYWEACVPKVRPGGILAVDNVLWQGRVLDPQSESDHAVHNFNEHVVKDDRVDLVLVAVRDGITIARKKW